MNINAQEILLLNKKHMKFGELNSQQPAPAVVSEPALTSPETALSALDAKGMNNIAFQGVNLAKLKKLGINTMAALALMTSASLASCTSDDPVVIEKEPVTIINNITIDMEQVTGLYKQMLALYQEMLEQQKISNEQLNFMNQSLLNLISMYQQGQIDANNFYAQMFEFMTNNQTNQEAIINLLINNGKSQEEANDFLQQILAEVKSGKISAAEAMDKIIKALNELHVDLQEMKDFYAKMIELYQEMVEQQKITNDQLTNLDNNLLDLINKYQQGQIDANNFYAQMFEFMTNNQVNQEAIIKLLMDNGKSQEDANSYLEQLLAEVKSGKISAAEAMNQIIKLLSDIQVDLQQVQEFYAKMIELYQEMVEQHKITNNQLTNLDSNLLDLINKYQQGQLDAKAFYAQMFEFMTNNQANQEAIIKLLMENGKSQEDANSYLKQLLAEVKSGKITAAEAMNQIMKQLVDMNTQLGEIIAQLKAISASFNEFKANYDADKNNTLDMLTNIYNQSKINTGYLRQMTLGFADMNANLTGIKVSINDLKALVEDPSKFNELMAKLDEIIKAQEQGSGTTIGSIDYERFEEMFKALGIKITDAINMSSSEIKALIEKFEKTYIANETTQNEILANITNKLEIISNFPNLLGDEFKAALARLEAAIKANTDATVEGNAAVTAELKAIQAQLTQIQATLDLILTKMGTLSAQLESSFKAFDAKFDAALEKLLAEFTTNMAEVKANQAVANAYLNTMVGKADLLLAELEKLKAAVDSNKGITLEQLTTLWEERDAANYARYEALIKAIGLKIDTSNAKLGDLIDAINAWKQEQKDYSSQLDRIISMLDGIDWSSPDYSAKLDKIIELLTNFKCNCQCSGNSQNNEGILGDIPLQ